MMKRGRRGSDTENDLIQIAWDGEGNVSTDEMGRVGRWDPSGNCSLSLRIRLCSSTHSSHAGHTAHETTDLEQPMFYFLFSAHVLAPLLQYSTKDSRGHMSVMGARPSNCGYKSNVLFGIKAAIRIHISGAIYTWNNPLMT